MFCNRLSYGISRNEGTKKLNCFTYFLTLHKLRSSIVGAFFFYNGGVREVLFVKLLTVYHLVQYCLTLRAILLELITLNIWNILFFLTLLYNPAINLITECI